MNKPNVIFICSDQQGAFAMGNSGNPWLKTPNLDALAASGVSFRKSYCSYPLCSPARASHFTGRMPHQVGVDYNGMGMKASPEGTMGTLFRNAGYETVWAGKWHLPEWYPRREDTVPGFHCVDYHKGPDDEAVDRLYTDDALRFLDGKRDKPFLLSLQLHNPHNICWNFHYELPPDDFFPSDERQLPPIDNFRIPDESEAVAGLRLWEMKGYEKVCRWNDFDWNVYRYLDQRHFEHSDRAAGELLRQMRDARWNEEEWRKYRYVYYRLVEKMDAQVGRVLNAVRENNLEDDTLIVFTSDHGDAAGAHQWARKQLFYEECVRVPMIMSWKNHIPQGIVDEKHIVSGIDLLPTICDYAGIRLDQDVPGKSARPYIESPNIPGRDFAVAETWAAVQSDMAGRMIVDHNYKYMVFDQGDKAEMLFDSRKDPNENHNVADKEAYGDIKHDLAGKLMRWIDKTNDHFQSKSNVEKQR